METELNPVEEIWMSEQAAVMFAFDLLGQIVVIAGMALAMMLLIGAAFLSDPEAPSSESGLAVKLNSALVAFRRKPGFGQTVLRVLALIVCLVAAAQA